MSRNKIAIPEGQKLSVKSRESRVNATLNTQRSTLNVTLSVVRTPYLPSCARASPARFQLEEPGEDRRGGQLERLRELLRGKRLVPGQRFEHTPAPPPKAPRRGPGRATRWAAAVPTVGKSSASTSSAPRQRIAPSFRSACVPAEVSEKTEPGTANTSRPKSAASRAVMSEPERRDASTTTTPAESPAMMRLRIGKFCGRGSVPGGYSESRRRSEAMRSFSRRVLARVLHVDAAPEDRDGSSGACRARPRAPRRPRRGQNREATATPGGRELPRQACRRRRGRSARRRASPRSRRPEAAAARAVRAQRGGRAGRRSPAGPRGYSGRRRSRGGCPCCSTSGRPALGLGVVARARSTARARSREPRNARQVLLFARTEAPRRRRARGSGRPEPLRRQPLPRAHDNAARRSRECGLTSLSNHSSGEATILRSATSTPNL